MGTETLDLQIAMLNAAVAEDGALDGAKLGLFTNSIVEAKDLTLDSITPADYTGYAAFEVPAWGTAYKGIDGRASVTGTHKQFNGPSSGEGDVVKGWYITDAEEEKLLYVERFSADVNLVDDSVAVVVDPTVKL